MGYELSDDVIRAFYDAPTPVDIQSSPQLPNVQTPSFRQEPPPPAAAAPSLRQGRTPTPSFRQGASSAVTDQILDNLMHVESSGNPNAFNKKTGARGLFQFTPITMKQFQKMGLTVDPSDPVSARAGAKALLEMYRDQAGGDLSAAVARFGGFNKKDPSGYVDRVMGPPLRPAPDPDTTTPTVEAAPTESYPGMTALWGEGHVPELAKKFPGADPAAAAAAAAIHGFSEPVWSIGQLIGQVPGLEGTGKFSTDAAKREYEAMHPAREAYPGLTAIGEFGGTLLNPMFGLIGKAGKVVKGGEDIAEKSLVGAAAEQAGQGAASSMLFTPVLDDTQSLALEKAKQGAFGGAAGFAGGLLSKSMGKAGRFLGPPQLSPRQQEFIDTLRKHHIPLDEAQSTQNLEKLRQKAAFVDHPDTAALAQKNLDDQLDAATRAFSRMAGGPETSNVNAHVLLGIKEKLGKTYERLQETYGAKIDKTTLDAMQKIQDDAKQTMNDSDYKVFSKQIDTILGKMKSNSGKWADGLDGKQLKQIQAHLGDLKGKQDYAKHAGDLSDLLNTAHDKNITNAADKLLLKQTNQQWGNYKALEKVAPQDPMGRVSPSKMFREIVGRSRKYLFYRENDEMLKLAQAFKEIVEPTLPNTGTTARWVMQHPWLSIPTSIGLKHAQKAYGTLRYDDPLRSPTKDMAAYLLSKGDELIPNPGMVSQLALRKGIEAQNEEYWKSNPQQAPERLR